MPLDSMDDDGSKTPIRTNTDSHSDSETQFFDSQSLSPKFYGADVDIEDGIESSQSTVPINDTVVYEEAFETQVVDLAGETQVMDFGFETQVVDYGGDTQVSDGVNFIEDMETQLLDSLKDEEDEDIDGEVSNSTEVLSDDDDWERKDACLFGETEVQSSSTSKESVKGSTEQPEIMNRQKKKSGYLPKQFTSVRTASLRASGLAAQNAALKASKSVSYLIPNSDQLSGKFDGFNNTISATNLDNKGDEERDIGKDSILVNDSRNKSTCRDGNLAARKLCYAGEKEELPNDNDGVSKACNRAGLSYIGSQEPGDLSQANALDFVDNFIKESMMEFEGEMGHGKSSGKKSKHMSAIKGTQKLAKKVSEKRSFEGHGIYDWDDSREDEGGGDILRRINRDLSGGGSLERKPPKPNVQDGTKRVMGIFNSNSKLLQNNLKVANAAVLKSKGMFGRNLMTELIVESDIDRQEKLLENGDGTTDVRFDTQMAAEAMESLFFGEGIDNHDVNYVCEHAEKESSSGKGKKRALYGKRPCPNDEDIATMQTRKVKTVDSILRDTFPISAVRRRENVGKKSKFNDVIAKPQKVKDIERKNIEKMTGESTVKKRGRPPKNGTKSLDGCVGTKLSGGLSLDKEKKVYSFGSIARRTRRSVEPIARRTRQFGNASDCSDETRSLTKSGRGTRGPKVLTSSDAQERNSGTVKLDLNKEFDKVAALTDSKEIDTLSFPRTRRRSARNLSRQVDNFDNIDDPPESSVNPGIFETSIRRKRSCRETRSSINQGSECNLSVQRSGGLAHENAEIGQGNPRFDESPKEKSKLLNSPCATPINCNIPVSDVSPVCMGDEYLTQSRENSKAKKSVIREIRRLSTTDPQSFSLSKDLRKRRDITDVRVLYSHHLDEDVIKHQKKILTRLGVSVASSMADATHFIADRFVRTRNMLEAIASGKPVVTHLWVESCGESNCFIDEKQYILRDAKKEKEYCFNMPNALASAVQYPILQGLRVLITPNTKPGLDIISNLVKVVGGQAVERVGRSALKDGVFPDDLLVLSCEEDYAICIPYIKQGATIYSSELLLNGIVSQKLEYDRYQLFADHVRKTRSAVLLKQDGSKFLLAAKNQ